MKIDCFITTNFQRPYFLDLTSRALVLSGLEVQFVNEPMLERYYECERRALSDVYVLSDDDVIPHSKDALRNLVKVLEKRKDYGMIGLSYKPNLKSEETSWCMGVDNDVLQFDHVGGIMAIRKGVLTPTSELPDYRNGHGDDRIVGKIFRENGYKVGILSAEHFIHLGEGKSTVWQ